MSKLTCAIKSCHTRAQQHFCTKFIEAKRRLNEIDSNVEYFKKYHFTLSTYQRKWAFGILSIVLSPNVVGQLPYLSRHNNNLQRKLVWSAQFRFSALIQYFVHYIIEKKIFFLNFAVASSYLAYGEQNKIQNGRWNIVVYNVWQRICFCGSANLFYELCCLKAGYPLEW